MKNLFNAIVIALSLFVAYMIYFFVLGNPNNFNDPEVKHEPKNGNIYGTIYTGGPLVGLLLSFILISVTFTFERSFSINKAKGKGNPANFIKNVTNLLAKGDLDGALAECDKQRGSMANVLRADLLIFK